MKHFGNLSCADVLERLDDYVDGELNEVDKKNVETHLSQCSECESFGQSYHVMRQALAELSE